MLIKKNPRGNVDIKIEIQNIKEKFRNFQDIEKRGDNVDILDIKEGFYVIIGIFRGGGKIGWIQNIKKQED